MARALVLSLLFTLASANVNACVESKCRGCSGEQCQLCREDKNTISACVSSCMDTICKGCGGEQCQLCREDAKTIESCCSEQVLALVTADLEMCKVSPPKNPCDGLYGAESLQCAWEEDVKSCVASSCQGCGGEQCQLCRDATRINGCCETHWHSVDPPQICKDAKAEIDSKDPCDGLYGAEGLQCAWEEDAKSCVEASCSGCSGEQCQLCHQDASHIATCCDDHYHSVDPPQLCKDSKEAAVTSCFDSKCRGCSGEPCQLCREDARSECCTGAMRTPSCETSKAILP